MVVNIYVLHGHWDTTEERGAIVVCVTPNKEKAKRLLDEIAKDNAAEYVSLCEEELEIDLEDTYLEIKDMKYGGFAGFYIVETMMHM